MSKSVAFFLDAHHDVAKLCHHPEPHMAKTERLFHLLHVLRTTPGPHTAADLANSLQVSPRTIHRDISALRSLGTAVDGSPGIGFSLGGPSGPELPGFGELELEAMVLGLQEVQQLGDPQLALAAGNALRGLQHSLTPELNRRLRHAALTLADRNVPRPSGVPVSDLRTAIAREQSVRFDYPSAQGSIVQHEADPFGLYYLDGSTVLLAWTHLREAHRLFRLDRMAKLEVIDHSFAPDRVPRLKAALDDLRQKPSS